MTYPLWSKSNIENAYFVDTELSEQAHVSEKH